MDDILEDFKVYLLETGRVTSEMTIQSYLGNANQLLEWLEANKKTINDLDRVLALKYLEDLKDKDYKPTTYNTKVNSLTNFNNYLKDQGVIKKDFIFGKDKIHLANNREVEIYTDEEMELIEAYLENEEVSSRDRLIIKMLKELGIRVSELTNLRLENLDVIGLQVEVHGKNNKIRNLPIKSTLAEDVKTYIAGERKDNKYSSSKYLIISQRSSKTHRNTILDVVKKMGDQLGIDSYCHKFRHTLATRMIRNGEINPKIVQEVLGHSSIDTVFEYYISTNKEEIRSAINNM